MKRPHPYPLRIKFFCELKVKALKIEIAPKARIEGHLDLIDDILKRYFEIEGALVTDESSLWDFLSVFFHRKCEDKGMENVLERINKDYAVEFNVKDELLLSDIAEKIKAQNPGLL